MKKLASIFVLCFLVLSSFAQTSGKIVYDMTFSSDNPDMAMATSMLTGSKMTISFMPKKSKIEMTMGAFGKFTTIADTKKKKVLMLVDMMGQKNAAEDKVDQAKADSARAATTVKLVDETKVILGYTCKKAIVTDKDGKEMTFWYTEDIKVDFSGQRQFNTNVPGVILEFATNQNEMVISFVATSFNKEVEKSEFDMSIPEGYTKKTPEEMQMIGQ